MRPPDISAYLIDGQGGPFFSLMGGDVKRPTEREEQRLQCRHYPARELAQGTLMRASSSQAHSKSADRNTGDWERAAWKAGSMNPEVRR